MKVKVLGTGCKNCKNVENLVRRAIDELGIASEVEKVENPKEIVELGVMSTPGLIINGKIKSTGRVPKFADISKWIKEESEQ